MMWWLDLLLLFLILSYVYCSEQMHDYKIPCTKGTASLEESIHSNNSNESDWKYRNGFPLELHDKLISLNRLQLRESKLEVKKAFRKSESPTLVKYCFPSLSPLSPEFGNHNGLLLPAPCGEDKSRQHNYLETLSEEISRKQPSEFKRISFQEVPLLSPEDSCIRNIWAPKMARLSPFKHIEFTIDANYSMVVGNKKKLFEESLTKQLAEQLNIHRHQIAGLKVSPGSVKVSFQLLNASKAYDHSFIYGPNESKSEIPFETIGDIEKLIYEKIEEGNLSIVDIQNQTLLNISTSPYRRNTGPEEMNAVMGTVIGGVLVIGMIAFIIVSFCKYRKEKQDSVRPIKNSYSVEGVTEIDGFDTFHNITLGNPLRSDGNFDETECNDALSIHLKPSSGIDSGSDASPSNISRKVVYTIPVADMNKPSPEKENAVNVTDLTVVKGSEYTIPSFPNMIAN